MKFVFAAAGALLFAATAAHAQDAGGAAKAPAAAPAAAATGAAPDDVRQKRFAACRDDLKSFCATVEKGGGRKVKCLKDNEAKLQPGCKAVLGEIEKNRAERKAGNASTPPAAK